MSNRSVGGLQSPNFQLEMAKLCKLTSIYTYNTYIYIYTHNTYVYIYIYIHIYIYIYSVYIYNIYIYVYMCIYIYICNTYIYQYIYIYRDTCFLHLFFVVHGKTREHHVGCGCSMKIDHLRLNPSGPKLSFPDFPQIGYVQSQSCNGACGSSPEDGATDPLSMSIVAKPNVWKIMVFFRFWSSDSISVKPGCTSHSTSSQRPARNCFGAHPAHGPCQGVGSGFNTLQPVVKRAFWGKC